MIDGKSLKNAGVQAGLNATPYLKLMETTEVSMKLNLELFEKVKAHILEEPRRLSQITWLTKKATQPLRFAELLGGLKEPPCGTVACVAGWTSLLSEKKKRSYDAVSQFAANQLVLGRGKKVNEAREHLGYFVFHYFPDAKSPYPVQGSRRYARAVVNRINKFIKMYS